MDTIKQKNQTRFLVWFITSLTVCFTVACGIALTSDQDDVNLGMQMDKEIRSKPAEYPILQGHDDVRSYVTGVIQNVLQSPSVTKKSVYPYKVEIIADDKTVNAFCTPGGYIYVYTGLLKFLDNEASLAGVLAHEIAHAECRHAAKRITEAYGLQMIVGIALGQNPSMLEQIVGSLFTNGLLLKNSRSDEMEADNNSMKYLQRSPYYPGGIKFFFEKINASGKGGASEFEKLFLTHPPSEERYKNVQQTMTQWNVAQPTEATLFSNRYQQAVKALAGYTPSPGGAKPSPTPTKPTPGKR
jgi:beta-barrel assembly-enhancing protease